MNLKMLPLFLRQTPKLQKQIINTTQRKFTSKFKTKNNYPPKLMIMLEDYNHWLNNWGGV